MARLFDQPSSDDTTIDDYDPLTDADYEGPSCIYCGEPCAHLDDSEPYCSALCACYAERDNREDR